MPKGWSDKEERKYEHIKEGELERGHDYDTAQEIAARTVNRDRREEGRTENRRTQGTGNPTQGYESRTRDELYNVARERKIAGRSRMSKDELIRALRD